MRQKEGIYFGRFLKYGRSVENGEKLYGKLPETPGVYLMKGSRGQILYIGKAGNLRRRVSSYFMRPYDSRIEKMISKVRKIDYQKTDTALEALILEAALIKKHSPPYNVREKDDKSFLYVEITKEELPRVCLVRGKSRAAGERFGPFTSASSIREALRIVRKIFPYSIHPDVREAKPRRDANALNRSRPCLDYELGLCPGTCIGAVERKEYLKNIRNIKLLFQGKKARILKNLEREMKMASKRLEFEKAAKIRGKIFALQHIQDIALLSDSESQLSNVRGQMLRIEGYDISSISGTSAVGAMVVFANLGNSKPRLHPNTENGFVPLKSEYRKFKIKTVKKINDVGMLKEVLRRRLSHKEWPLPALLLIDGGKGQVNGVRAVLDEFGLKIPVVGIAKGIKRKKNEFIGPLSSAISPKTLIKVRNEAHRFAVQYHRKLRSVMLK